MILMLLDDQRLPFAAEDAPRHIDRLANQIAPGGKVNFGTGGDSAPTAPWIRVQGVCLLRRGKRRPNRGRIVSDIIPPRTEVLDVECCR